MKKPRDTKKNLNANAAKGSLLSIIGFVVTKADDHKIINKNGKILIIIVYRLNFYLILVILWPIVDIFDLELYFKMHKTYIGNNDFKKNNYNNILFKRS